MKNLFNLLLLSFLTFSVLTVNAQSEKKGSKGKPKFKCIIGDAEKEYIQSVSSAHLNFIQEAYPQIPKIKYSNKDGFKKLWLSDYKTASK